MKNMKNLLKILKNNESGFSLTELILTMGIVSLTAGLASAKMNDILPSARDAQRLANIHQVQTALSLYYADHGQYPLVKENELSQKNWQEMGKALESNDTRTYMPEVPNDPLNNDIYNFKYQSDGQTFKIDFETEDPNDESPRIAWGL
jgi:prepilin-type N-terminal cleavage/methylation domain-containing protein